MVTGFNVDVKHAGKVYHVQTEDKGRRNPVIETLVYISGTGRIVHKERLSYADHNADDAYNEAEVARMVSLQHERIVQKIRSGAFDERKPFGEEFITSRTLDECVLDFLVEQARGQSLGLAVVGESPFQPGEKAWLLIRATHQGASTPIAGAAIRGRVIRSSGKPEPLPEVKTDARGEARLEFTVPAEEGNAAVIVQGESKEHGQDEIRRLIR